MPLDHRETQSALRSSRRSASRTSIQNATAAEREYAYDRQSSFGRFDKALDAAALNKWTVIDVKNDWKIIFPFEKKLEQERNFNGFALCNEVDFRSYW
jgi:hypothetical protein